MLTLYFAEEKVKQVFGSVDYTYIFYCFRKRWVGKNLLKTPSTAGSQDTFFLPHNKVTINVNIILLDAFPSVTDASVGWYTVAVKDIVKIKAFEKFLHFLISEV